MQNYKPQIKEVSHRQDRPSKGLFLAYILLGIVAFGSPFIHLFFSTDKNDFVYEEFGFMSYHAMFFALGLPVFIFLISFLFYVISKEVRSDFFKRFCIVLGFCSQLLSLFFIVWTLFPRIDLENGDIDFPRYLYKVFSFIIALILTYAFYWLYKYFTSKQSSIPILINHILKTRVETVYPLAETEDIEEKAQLVKENDERIVATIKKVKTHA